MVFLNAGWVLLVLPAFPASPPVPVKPLGLGKLQGCAPLTPSVVKLEKEWKEENTQNFEV